MAPAAQLCHDRQRQVTVLVGIVGTQAEDVLAFDETPCHQLARDLGQLGPGEVLSAEGDGVETLRFDRQPLHLGLQFHVFGDHDHGVGGRDTGAERLPVHEPFESVLVVGAIPIGNEVEKGHDHALGDRPPEVNGEPPVRLHQTVCHVASVESLQRLEVHNSGRHFGERQDASGVRWSRRLERDDDLTDVAAPAQRLDGGEDGHLRAHFVRPEVRPVHDHAQAEGFGTRQTVREPEWGRRRPGVVVDEFDLVGMEGVQPMTFDRMQVVHRADPVRLVTRRPVAQIERRVVQQDG